MFGQNKDYTLSNGAKVQLPEIISKCPHCGANNSFQCLGNVEGPIPWGGITPSVRFIFQCSACKEITVMKYIYLLNQYIISTEIPHFYPVSLAPKTILDEKLEEISPDFINIYQQAETAENCGCLEVAGPGYRKALEFLVKDYFIHKQPNEKQQIIKTNLGNLITKLPNKNDANIGNWAVKFGNDEVHFYKDFPQKTIKDLKDFIVRVAQSISNENLSLSLGEPPTKKEHKRPDEKKK